MRRMRRAVGVGLVPTTLLAGVPAAQAYPQEPNCPDRLQLWWRIADGDDPLWTAGGVDRRVWTRAAINTVDDALDHDGARLVQLTEGRGGLDNTTVNVYITDQLPPGTYGVARCPVGPYWEIELNYNPDSSYRKRRFWKVARHEMLHLVGAHHGGDIDSQNGDNPATMSTCIDESTFPTVNRLTQDDHAYENWLKSSLPNRQLHANVGFEQGTSFLGRTAGTFTYKTSGGATGPGYLAWQSPDSHQYLYQTVALHTGDDDESYRAVANARSPGNDYKTVVNVGLWRRNIVHQSTPTTCEYPDGVVNPNGWTASSDYLMVSESGSTRVGTSWTLVPAPWANPERRDGYLFQVRVYGFAMAPDGSMGHVLVDNVRGEGT
jgi:hypothetical protein